MLACLACIYGYVLQYIFERGLHWIRCQLQPNPNTVSLCTLAATVKVSQNVLFERDDLAFEHENSRR